MIKLVKTYTGTITVDKNPESVLISVHFEFLKQK